jgi:hypothetical protein
MSQLELKHEPGLGLFQAQSWWLTLALIAGVKLKLELELEPGLQLGAIPGAVSSEVR